MTTPAKPMRAAMPTVAGWVDELREAFGRDLVDGAIRNAMAGGSDFYARENGQEIGHKLPVDRNKTVLLSDCYVGKLNLLKKDSNGRH